MLSRRPVAQLQHISQHRDVLPLSLFAAQNGQRHDCGLRPCIIAVVNDGKAVFLIGVEPHGRIGEVAQRIDNVLLRAAALQRHGDGRQRVVDIVDPVCGQRDRKALSESLHSKHRIALIGFNMLGHHIAFLVCDAEIEHLIRIPAAQVCEHWLVSIKDDAAARLQALQDLQLGLQNPLPASQIFNVHGANVVDDRNVRPGNLGQVGHLPEVVHAHLQHRHLTVRLHVEQGKRQAQAVVVVLGRLAGDVGLLHDGRQHLLGGRLSHAAGDRQHLGVQRRPVARGNAAQRPLGVLYQHRRNIRRLPFFHQHRRSALLQHLLYKIMAVHTGALDCHI